jgi:hypothetical protein
MTRCVDELVIIILHVLLTTVGNHNRHIHPKTVRNRLHEFGLRARRPYIGFPLTRARRACRMAWLAAHGPRQFPTRQWRRVFFTDESRFILFCPDGRRRVYRRHVLFAFYHFLYVT